MISNLRTNFLRALTVASVALITVTVRAEAATDAVDKLQTGTIHGIVAQADGNATGNVHLSICRMQDFTCAYMSTDASGAYMVTSLKPGRYQVAEALPGGMGDATIGEVIAGHDVAANLALHAATPEAGPASSLEQTPADTPAAPAPAKNNSFFHRLGRSYVADWGGSGPGTVTAEARRGTPAPLYSPPYPATDWPIGGTPVIGAPDGQTYPLMQAINENKSTSKIYGWIEVGANGSTNNKTNAGKGIAANAPAAYDVYSNTIQLDQAALYFEKIENTAQKTHFDSGYRLTLLYGTDYRFTTSHGLLSQQLLVKNSQYGFDPVMFYYDMYFPKVAEGLVLRVGRYISLPDIEAQLAPNNYTYSHSILYTYDCYTMTGINATVKMSNHLTVQAGLSPGCDTMPWTTDAKLTGNFCATYTWSNGGDAINGCANTLNDQKYAYNNLSAYYLTYYHRFSNSWHTDTESWYQYVKGAPNMYWFNSGGLYAKTATTPYPETTGGGVNLNFGAVCQDPSAALAKQSSRCYAPDFAIVNYVEHNFWNNTASLNIRNEFVDDIKGQRTGTPAKYEEHMVGFDFWAGSTITFRPELSFTKCYSKYKALDGRPVSCTDIAPGASIASYESTVLNGSGATIPTGLGKTSSLSLAADLIWHF